MKIYVFFRHKHEFENNALFYSLKNNTPINSIALLKLKATIKSDWTERNIKYLKENMAYDFGQSLRFNYLEAFLVNNKNIVVGHQSYMINEKNNALFSVILNADNIEINDIILNKAEKVLFEKLNIGIMSSTDNKENSDFFSKRGYTISPQTTPRQNENIIKATLTKENYFKRSAEKEK